MKDRDQRTEIRIGWALRIEVERLTGGLLFGILAAAPLPLAILGEQANHKQRDAENE